MFLPTSTLILPSHLGFFYLISAVLAFVAVFLYVANHFLRKRVKDANRELKLRNEKIALAIHAGRLAIWGYDVQKDLLYNIEDKIFPDEGCTAEEAMLTVHSEDREAFNALFIRAISGDVPDKTIRVRWRFSPDLPWEYIEKEFAVIRSKDGTVETVIGTHRDVTEDVLEQYKEEELLRKYNTELIELNRQLEIEKERAQEADNLKSAFLANMSHEIRTPLNAIVGFSELMQTVEEPEEKEEYVQIIQNNNEILLRLIGDILDLSKIESGTMELQRKKFDLVPFFDELSTSFYKRATNPNVEFICENPYKSFVTCLDRNRIAQIFTNFATNSMKYTPKGYIKIGYTYMDGGIKVYVEDTGIGIPSSKHHRIFYRFEKLDDFAQGTGLGLSICKAIIEAGKGKIGFTSDEGQGSTFWAWVPCEAEIELKE